MLRGAPALLLLACATTAPPPRATPDRGPDEARAVASAADAEPAREPAPCIALELTEDSRIELTGATRPDRYPDTSPWPAQIVEAIRASYCPGAPLHGQPAPRFVGRIVAELRGTATATLPVDAGKGRTWPMLLGLERGEDGRWAVSEANSVLARTRLMKLARWLEQHPEVDIFSTAGLPDGWLRARARDPGGSTLCLLAPDGRAHCYRDPRAIEHFGHGPTAYPPEPEESEEDWETEPADAKEELAPRKLGFTLLLWPFPHPGGRTTEPWLFDTETRRACRAKPIRWPEDVLDPIYDWRSTSTRLPKSRPARPKPDAGDCEPLKEVPVPAWVELVAGIRVSVVPGATGPVGLSLDLPTGDLINSAEHALCVLGEERRCGIVVHPNDDDRFHFSTVLGTIQRQVSQYHEKQERYVQVPAPPIHVLVLDHWMTGSSSDLSYVDTSHVQFLQLVEGRWKEVIDPLLIGSRERIRSPDYGGTFWMKRFYEKPTLRPEEHIELELVVADSLLFRGGKLKRHKVDRSREKRRCVGQENGAWTDFRLEHCRKGPR
ncbi:MAG: hypothetical protein OXT09_22680 [Myxococcales bacterium]|nr:hypothetical protein [Myxococcales bacterium]